MSPITRHPNNPILSARDIPYPASLIFNAGVAKYEGRYVMIFRNDYGTTEEDWKPFKEGKTSKPPGLETSLGLAFSDDGVNWQIEPKPCWKVSTDEVLRVYDPRITVIDGVAHICFAMFTTRAASRLRVRLMKITAIYRFSSCHARASIADKIDIKVDFSTV